MQGLEKRPVMGSPGEAPRLGGSTSVRGAREGSSRSLTGCVQEAMHLAQLRGRPVLGPVLGPMEKMEKPPCPPPEVPPKGPLLL